MTDYLRNAHAHMLHRCYNPNDNSYHRYGGRGIRVCSRWMKFDNFKQDIGERPGKNYQLDRIDNDGDYTPENCRWATRKQQARNRSSNRVFDFNGKKMCVPEISEVTGVEISLIRDRIYKGKDIHEAASDKNKLNERIIEFNGVAMSISAWSRKIGVHRGTLTMRFRNGWTVERALTTKTRRW